MEPASKRLPVAFYRSRLGTEPVRNWLLTLPVEDRRVLGFDIGLVEFGMPLGDGLWEVRSSLADGRIARVMFCIAQQQMVLLHGFIKKTQKTPGPELALARRRQKDVAG